MNITDLVANYIFSNHASLLTDGTTADGLRTTLSGLGKALDGLSNSEMKGLVESSTAFKSYVDTHTADGINTRESNLKREYDTKLRIAGEEKETLQSSITTLRANMPLSADPAELRKQALDETDLTKREILNMKADNIELKNMNAERVANEEKQLAELTREKLVNVARTKLGDRKIPKSLAENLHMFIGSDEETTIGKIDIFNNEWDDFTKDMRTSGVDPSKPSGVGEPEIDVIANMNNEMDKIDF